MLLLVVLLFKDQQNLISLHSHFTTSCRESEVDRNSHIWRKSLKPNEFVCLHSWWISIWHEIKCKVCDSHLIMNDFSLFIKQYRVVFYSVLQAGNQKRFNNVFFKFKLMFMVSFCNLLLMENCLINIYKCILRCEILKLWEWFCFMYK